MKKYFSFESLQLPRKLNHILGTQEAPYDATRSGPLCSQLGLDAEVIDHYMVRRLP